MVSIAMDPRQRQALIERLRQDAARIADRFALQYAAIEPERANVTSRYGVCYSNGLIKIRLNHARTGNALRYSSLVDTLCHELAHLRHFNHGPQFKSFFWELLHWARREGIYCPRPVKGRTPASTEPPRSSYTSRLTLVQRNGVPVFTDTHTSSQHATPAIIYPWRERLGDVAAPSGITPKMDPPQRPSPPKENKPIQLSLF